MNPDQNTEQPTSRHAVSEPWRCIEMTRKYGWKLVNIEPNGTKDLPYDCIFQGQTDFPDYLDKKEN